VKPAEFWRQLSGYQRRGLWSVPLSIAVVAVLFWKPLGAGSETTWLNVGMLAMLLIRALLRFRVPLEERA
jgi:hypothetical protein